LVIAIIFSLIYDEIKTKTEIVRHRVSEPVDNSMKKDRKKSKKKARCGNIVPTGSNQLPKSQVSKTKNIYNPMF
jgi:hypothetical protein